MGECQYGMRSCSNGCSPGIGSMNHPTLSVCSSSTGTRHSKWPAAYSAFGHRHTRPTFHSSFSSSVSVLMRRYRMPNSNSSNAMRVCVGAYSLLPPRRSDWFECSHSKWTGSIEFSWHCSQLHGISENTTCLKPRSWYRSQSHSSGTGPSPMYAHSSPAFACTRYAVARTFSLKFASGCAICSNG